MAEDRIGQQLGNYRIIQRLGEGGFAEVYLGEHIYLKTQAAIKVLHTRLANDDISVFTSEAQTIARLKHPHIVRVLEFGLEGSTPFLVMDYAPNGTLRQRHPRGSRLNPALILSYVKQVAEALHYAHERRLVHRDVKPENMLIGERGEALLSDFGIATVAQSSRYEGTQEVAGTVAYMAPEQVQGKPRAASDQYALGVVIYEWLTGERPFQGSFSEVASQHVLAPPPPLREKLPGIAPALEEVVMVALAKDPKARFASVQAFANAFEQACQVAVSAQVPMVGQSPAPRDTAKPPAGPFDEALLSAPTQITPDPPPAVQAAPPGWKDVGVPAPGAPAETFGGMSTISPPPAVQVAASSKETGQPRPRRSRWRVVVLASLALVLLLGAAGGAWALFFQTASFQQEVKTSQFISGIRVGLGIDIASSAILDETDTFKAGNTVFVVFTLGLADPLAALELDLIRSDGHEEEQSIVRTKASNVFWGSAPLAPTAQTGVYQWVVYYIGSAEASITFQVVL